jgi:predicted DNA-binding protein with PD1-like motif
VCSGDVLKYKRSGEFIVVRLDEDDKLIENLEKICTQEKVTSGIILSAVGAVKSGTLIYRRGCHGDFSEHLEIIGNGNVSKLDGKVKIHMHIMGGNEKSVRAGHLIEGVASVFCEVIIRIMSGFTMERKIDESLVKQKVLNPYVLEP